METLLIIAAILILVVRGVCEWVDGKAKEIEFEQSGRKMFY